MIESIHAQLSAWGRWVMRTEVRALGYPSHSAGFGDYMPRGVGYKSHIPGGFGCSDDMRTINDVLLSLHANDRILCAEYYVVGPNWESVCSRMAISKSVLYRELHRVQDRILMRLCGGS